MQLKLTDPDSIIAWWQVFPERHDSFLTYKINASPEFAPAISEARRRIAADPVLAGLLRQVEQRTRQHEAQQAAFRETPSANEFLHRELAA
ncbi:hypothetical protein J2X20_000476 [Pelomonas saccharophila]|uniref:Uncharacterized protein n=1 Tax=Roseateles saccharophilus TaxID=304 RepID=A0ABU1YG63_ROSSA|nr:hypothetical protein [Roseateles saccharophilus]MDR7267847.1 hypothetical protein [Roseateles saccharophilus]